MSGHNRVWAQNVWAQTCLGTNVCGHKRGGTVVEENHEHRDIYIYIYI